MLSSSNLEILSTLPKVIIIIIIIIVLQSGLLAGTRDFTVVPDHQRSASVPHGIRPDMLITEEAARAGALLPLGEALAVRGSMRRS